MTVPALGVAYVPTLPPERLRALAEAVDSAGLDHLWVWEDCFKESAVASAAAALAWTERVQVGIGLMPAPLRNVAVCAMEVAMLERLFPGRVLPGVGHGVQEWMDQVGGRVGSPLTLLREYATALRRLLAGERVSVEGRYVRLRDVALDWPPLSAPPLAVGGAGPKSLALAGELGDWVLLGSAVTTDEVREACRVIAAGAATAHPDGDAPTRQIMATLIAATGPDAEARVREEIPKWGRDADLAIGVAGDADAFARAITELAGFGVTAVCIQPTEDEPDLEGFVHFLGREVRPRLTSA